MFHELMSRDRADGRATGHPQGVGSEAYLNGTSQGPTPEGRLEGRPYPWSQQAIHETSGLRVLLSFKSGEELLHGKFRDVE
jgi:hypothetical protein